MSDAENILKQTLKVMLCGNVDDGKSTLLGRLLYDSNSLLDDQVSGLKKSSGLYGHEDLNLAFLTDGLKAERENRITIDVAYRYFATEKRKFILIDSPGHFEYIANMASAASQAEVAVVLIDAVHGLREQTLRHFKILDIFSVPQIIFCINKMDLVDYSEARYQQLKSEIQSFFAEKKVLTHFMPICALSGEFVTPAALKLSQQNLSWYKGSDLLTELENFTEAEPSKPTDFIFSTQMVFENTENFYFYGDILSGEIKNKEFVACLQNETGNQEQLEVFEIISDTKKYVKGIAVGLVFAKSTIPEAASILFKSMIKAKNQRLILYKKVAAEDSKIKVQSVTSLTGLMIQFNRAQKSTLKIGQKFIFINHSIENICSVVHIFSSDDIFANIELEFDSVQSFIESSGQSQLSSGILIDPVGFNTVGVLSQVKASN